MEEANIDPSVSGADFARVSDMGFILALSSVFTFPISFSTDYLGIGYFPFVPGRSVDNVARQPVCVVYIYILFAPEISNRRGCDVARPAFEQVF